MRELLRKAPPEKEEFDAQGWSLLHHAANAGTTECLKLLLADGVQPDTCIMDSPTALDVLESSTVALTASQQECQTILDAVPP